jgi:hypothetical protein
MWEGPCERPFFNFVEKKNPPSLSAAIREKFAPGLFLAIQPAVSAGEFCRAARNMFLHKIHS